MDKIVIKETKQADSRTADHIPSKSVLLKESKDHIAAVSASMTFFATMMSLAGKMHDHTKIEYIDEFYENFVAVMQDKTVEFKSLGWWKKHLTERHHLLDRCPDDVNLVDVMEMICDCVCAGLARSGEVRPLEISLDILQKAAQNTAALLESMIVVK